MAATYMLRRYLASQAAADTPAAVAERAVRQEACRRAREDRAAKYPRLTADQFEEANLYQERRIAVWTRALIAQYQ